MSLTTQFLMSRDVTGAVSFGLIPSSVKYSTTLEEGVAQEFTTPSDAEIYEAIFAFQPGVSVWCALNDEAELPGEEVALTNSEQIPTAWRVQAGDTISMITNSATAEVGVKFYAVP